MSHAVRHPVNKTAHTGINQFHVASQVSGTRPPVCFCNGSTKADCSQQCPDGTCPSDSFRGRSPSRCPSGTYLAGSCPVQTVWSSPSCDNPNP